MAFMEPVDILGGRLMTSYKKNNKLASMLGFTSSYKDNLEMSRMLNTTKKFPHVKYVRQILVDYHLAYRQPLKRIKTNVI